MNVSLQNIDKVSALLTVNNNPLIESSVEFEFNHFRPYIRSRKSGIPYRYNSCPV